MWLNVGMAIKVPPVSNVKDPVVMLKVLLQVIVPLFKVNVGPLNVKVIHEIIPVPIVNVPPVYVNKPLVINVKVNDPKANVVPVT